MRKKFRIMRTNDLEIMSVRMTEQIHAIAQIWGALQKRSLATLGTRLTNDSRFFDKMASGGTCTTKTFEKFLTFFRDASNWPNNVIPQAAVELLDNFENIASESHAVECHGGDAAASVGDDENRMDHGARNTAADDAASTGQIGQMSREVAA
jgi:hypothetical protein